MIGNPNWFARRKWGGWGLSPVKWQGWAYIAVFVALIFGTQYIAPDQKTRMIAIGVVGTILVLDTIDIMFRMKKDERETIHEAIAERNALWVIIFTLSIGVAYQVAQGIMTNGTTEIDPVIIVAIFAGLITKAISNYYLDKKD